MKGLLIIFKGGIAMKRLFPVAVPLFLLLLFCSCTNVQRLYDKGNYQAVVDNVARMKSPGQEDLLLQTKAYVKLGEESKALESALLYLLGYDGKDPQGRSYAVQILLDTCTSERIAVLVLDKDDGPEARIALYKAYCNLGDYENAVRIMNILSAEMESEEFIELILDTPISDERILEAFLAWSEELQVNEQDIFLSLLCRFSSEVTLSEPVAWKFLSLTDVLMGSEYYNSDNRLISTVLKIKGNILDSLFDKVNARIYWTQAYNLNPDDEELGNKLK